jgi:anti-sigma factor RsiW
MSCQHIRQMLDAWIDHELDDVTSAELAEHITHCTTCSAIRAERLKLRRLVKSGAPYFVASSSLRQSISQKLAVAANQQQHALIVTPPVRLNSNRRTWWQMAGLVTFASLASSALTVWILHLSVANNVPTIQAQLIEQHVASLANPKRMVDVASTDRHTVKPWFQGKLDFAPTVADLADAGYTLLGGRLEKIESQPTAVLIYQTRKHPISLFMTRATATKPMSVNTIRGFSVANWASGGVEFYVVADTDLIEVERLATLLQVLH